MERIFKKDFKFSVESYEEYQNQELISSGNLDAAIYCRIIGGKAHILITGMKDLDIDRQFSFDVNHLFSRILEAGGMVTSSRIQYVSGSLGTDTEPYICILSCRFEQIVTVRFGFADFNASKVFPMAKRIYDFSGDMEELGGLSEESIEVLEENGEVFEESKNIQEVQSTSQSPLNLYNDKFCVMVDKADYNPFNIVTDEQMNEGYTWSSMIDSYEKDLKEILSPCIQNGMNLESVISAYIFNHVETIFNSKGFVPKVLIDAIINDVYSAIQRTPYAGLFKDIEIIKYDVYYNFTNR